MKKSGKLLAIGALITALMVPAGGAIAASGWSGFGVALPPLQQGAYVLHQTKNVAGQAGEINVSFVGGTYKLNARQCRSAGVCGTERFNIGPGSYRTLPSGNKVPAGKTAWLDLHNSTWTVVRVDAVGSWRAN
jgi:hypothetical protein